MGQIKGIREKGKKRGRKGAADVRELTCVYFFRLCYNKEREFVKKEQRKVLERNKNKIFKKFVQTLVYFFRLCYNKGTKQGRQPDSQREE